MQNEIQELVQAIKLDYAEWSRQTSSYEDKRDIVENMISRFNDEIQVLPGRKYVKIVTGGSVWGFVVAGKDTKFRQGDILKAASWASPARNAARGNILDGGYTIRWTGPLYLA